ncbi:MAG: hypothetical protein EWV49_12975 [Microcystis aeruginosa Ma_QC_Ch_20071001_S25]|jgi:hypothetical protein|uniref:2TM domain-containing protein n=2 Tax=Microcystis aeruginosa TaxID=1126 RepID=A0A552G084_MICAE|nr:MULTISPECIES: hypothetical protein [unclassified Microcystis]MCA2763625.1 hypothetical protein [Microcystis sp. M151S2]MCA2927900.1 hypothetical protein [Microcystis sp. M020S1]MCA2936943.1 hypothetical protein [Microcystis sp. M015S1]NCQ86269.1 hypothetical protein [Microcystis aeruginosa W13-18]NCR37212.1 hypothetical protein [Microcystis aeruginosa S11-05]NCR50743.1 hypothetical protein [Microcystis aeruginosa S11-01]NCR56548.1 hypothetical protein [Microcystis aeruginosa LL13-06]NCS4
MPPRWPRQPDRKNDPAFRRLDDRMNFAVHVAAFLAINSGLWFFHIIKFSDWTWLNLFTGIWAILLVGHLIYLAAIANYSVTSHG